LTKLKFCGPMRPSNPSPETWGHHWTSPFPPPPVPQGKENGRRWGTPQKNGFIADEKNKKHNRLFQSVAKTGLRRPTSRTVMVPHATAHLWGPPGLGVGPAFVNVFVCFPPCLARRPRTQTTNHGAGTSVGQHESGTAPAENDFFEAWTPVPKAFFSAAARNKWGARPGASSESLFNNLIWGPSRKFFRGLSELIQKANPEP